MANEIIKSDEKNREKLTFKEWFKKPKNKIIFFTIIFGIIVLLAAGYIAYLRYFKKGTNSTNSGQNNLPTINYSKTPEIKKVASKLDGALYPEDVSNRHPLAIMVENHPEARPQSGLSKAKVIYEAVTEGGITRFMAIFGPEGAEKVGPVRSARTYYLDWDLEYDGFYAHVGGNLDALNLIPKIGIKDLDQFKYGTQTYWREPQAGKATEHTMYTDTAKLWDIAKNNKWDMNADFTALEFKEDAPKEQRPELASVTIDFSSPNFKVKWIYDRENNNYKRELAGTPHKDAISGEQLTAKNIIIQEVQRWYAPTEINEEGWAMKTVGSGKAKVLLDGKVYDTTWKKPDRNSRTKYYDNSGTELKLNPGNAWYEIVQSDTSVVTQ